MLLRGAGRFTVYAQLDLTWKPSADQDAPPLGKGSAIIRGDDYTHTIRVEDGWLNNLQDFDYAAQIRALRLTGATAGVPLVSFTVTLDQDGDDLLIILTVGNSDTLELPSGWFWDLQQTATGVITTLLSGRGKTLDDVTRVA